MRIFPPCAVTMSLSPGLSCRASRASRGMTIWFFEERVASAMLYIIAKSKAVLFLSQPVFKLDSLIGFFVAVFHNYWSVERDIPFGGSAFRDGTGAGNHYGIFRYFERGVACGAVDFASDQVVERGGAGEYRAGPKHSPGADQRAFEDAAVAAYKDVVFDDDGGGVDGLENASDLGGGAEVDSLADLSAGTDQGMGVEHSAFVHIGPDVDEHGRHADYRRSHISAHSDG